MTECTGSADPLTLRLLPQHNPNARDRRDAWNELLGAGAMQQLHDFVRYRNGTGVPDDDIVQDTLALAYIKVENGDYTYRNTPFIAYLRQIAKYKILEATREREYKPLEEIEEILPDQHAERFQSDVRHDRAMLLNALEGLPARRREIVMLSEMFDFTSEEIAHRLQIRADLVRKDKSLAMQQLRRSLTPELKDRDAAAA